MATDAVRGGDEPPYDERALVDLIPTVRRVVGARIKDPHTLEDLVQETLARLMSSSSRIDPDKLSHYASVTARHVVASYAERNDRARSRSHLLAEPPDAEAPDAEAPTAGVLRQEEQEFVAAALAHLSAADRDLLLAHEVDGDDTRTMADRARLHARGGRGPVEPCARGPPRRVPPRRGGRRAAHRPLPARAAIAVHGRPASPAGAGRQRPPPRVHDVRAARRPALRAPRAPR